ncbi:hypothetical protein [Salinibacter ruber]|uniref:hypothetical protein n=1 Tax=Salinibacter ruber TaxID=146919 RepID=UPI003C6E4D6C
MDVHRHTVSDWIGLYEEGGIEKIQEVGDSGPEPGQESIPSKVMEALKERLSDRRDLVALRKFNSGSPRSREWIFLTRRSMASCATSSAPNRRPLSAGTPAHQPSKKTSRSK